MNIPTRFALALALCTFLTGCGDSGIVGKWHGSIARQGTSVATTFTFSADGKETMQAVAAFSGRQLNILSSGTYVIKDNTLTQTFDSMTMDGRALPMASLSAALKTESDTFKLAGDTLTVTKVGGTLPLTLTRVKN